MVSRPGGLLGFSCFCIPRQWLVGLVALTYFSFGMMNVSYVLINLLLSQGAPPNHQMCIGAECQAIVSCEGLKDGSYHVHMTYIIIGGVYLCGTGLLGLANSNPEAILYLGYFFQILSLISIASLIFDGSYIASCNSYPQNVVDEAVMWPIANNPTSERQKAQIHAMAFFPKKEVDSLLDFNLWYFYVVVVVFLNIWYFYLGVQIKHISDMLQHGFYGMGRNFDFGEWRDAVNFNQEIGGNFSLNDGSTDAYGATEDNPELHKMQQKLGSFAKHMV